MILGQLRMGARQAKNAPLIQLILRMFISDVKSTEFQVEKRHKQLQDWRSTEAKAKAKSYAATKDNEKCQVGL